MMVNLEATRMLISNPTNTRFWDHELILILIIVLQMDNINRKLF